MVESDPVSRGNSKRGSFLYYCCKFKTVQTLLECIVQNVLRALYCPTCQRVVILTIIANTWTSGEISYYPFTWRISAEHLSSKQMYSRALGKWSWARKTRTLSSWKLILSEKCTVKYIIMSTIDKCWRENESEKRDRQWREERGPSASKETIVNKEVNGMRERTMPSWRTGSSSVRGIIKCKAPQAGVKLTASENQEDSVGRGWRPRQRWARSTEIFSHW